jgi:hypothetical protein
VVVLLPAIRSKREEAFHGDAEPEEA